MQTGTWSGDYSKFISHIAFCILAYSGVESVLQTAGLVRTWQEIRKAYLFLGLTVGIVTPLVAALALSAPIDFHLHEGDLITHYASMLNGALVRRHRGGPGQLHPDHGRQHRVCGLQRIDGAGGPPLRLSLAHRHQPRQSLYRIHLLSATFFSGIILITAGSQSLLADMYALGLLASFCINMGSLILYRYFMGT